MDSEYTSKNSSEEITAADVLKNCAHFVDTRYVSERAASGIENLSRSYLESLLGSSIGDQEDIEISKHIMKYHDKLGAVSEILGAIGDEHGSLYIQGMTRVAMRIMRKSQ